MHFKRKTLFTMFAFIHFLVIGQILKPAELSYNLTQNGIELGEETYLVFEVQLDDTWQLYSNIQNYDIGPLPAVFEFEPNSSYQLIGGIKPIGVKSKYEPVFGVTSNYFEGTAEFRQKIKILRPNLVIKGTVNYQVCTTVNGKCINLEEDFEFQIKTKD